jgi:hypothetical protein
MLLDKKGGRTGPPLLKIPRQCNILIMKTLIRLFILGGFFISGCEEDVKIQYEPFETKPVIYCVIDPNDTIHSIRIERVFSGGQPPAITAAIPDSLYFKDIKVTFRLSSNSGNWGTEQETKLVELFDKKPGYFANSRSYVYQFEKILKSGGRNLFSRIRIQVEIPGLPTLTATSKIISDPAVYSPIPSQQFIYIVHDRPLLIQWSGGAWNEVDIRFEINEMYPDSTVKKYLQFQKVNQVLINGRYYEIRIPFELIVQEIDKTLKVDRNIVKRYFGPINFTIHTGLQEYATYIEFLYGINDFNENPFSNIEGALGLVTSRSSINKGPMLLDQSSRFELSQDPVLQKLNFIEW